MMDLWKYYNDIRNFSNIGDDSKQEVINVMLTEKAALQYNYTSLLSDLLPHFDDDLALKMTEHWLEKGNSYSFDCDHVYDIIREIYNRDKNKERIKELARKSKHKRILRSLLIINDMTLEDENLGLRALAGMKYAPDILFVNKYKPSLNAIKNLPPVMRLKALESLLSNKNIAYNLFENFPNSDEFKSLLFGAVFRHRDRVEIVWDSYNEIKELGVESTITLRGMCENCGVYDVSIKSTRVRTRTGLNKTNIGQRLQDSSCALCGRYGQSEKQVICS